MDDAGALWIREQLSGRVRLWEELVRRGGPADVSASLIRELGIYRGQAGIYSNLAQTKSSIAPNGAALALVNIGGSYSDEVSEAGAIYDYPNTERSGRTDANEIESARTAARYALPVFFVGPGRTLKLRSVRLGYVDSYNDELRLLLITFCDGPSAVPSDLGKLHFDAFEEVLDASLAKVRARPHQQRFAFDVFVRYGHQCAVCEMQERGIIQACHLAPKARGGVDDARNGLPLCQNHHAALDRKMWSIDPTTTSITVSDQSSFKDLQITRADLTHLRSLPDFRSLAAING